MSFNNDHGTDATSGYHQNASYVMQAPAGSVMELFLHEAKET